MFIVASLCVMLYSRFTTLVVFEQDVETFCENENMRYDINIPINPESEYILKGKKFNCAYLEQLNHFRLSDRYALKSSFKVGKFPEDIVFVFGTSDLFFKSLKTALYSIQRTFAYAYRKIVVYDLGGLSNNSTIMRELNGVCKLELRMFNFSRLPVNVRNLDSFSWKIYLIAEALLEFNTFMYFDTSVYFLANNYSDYFHLMEEGRLTGLQFTKSTNHGVRFATHPSLLKYLPLHTAFKNDIEMQEANMIVVHKSEYTRQILKWALLCASEKECIQPTGSVFECDVHSEGLLPDGTCNRLDQSAFSILINNAEENILRSNGPAANFVSHRSCYHPSRLRDRHLLLKKKSTMATIDTCAAGKENRSPQAFNSNSAIQFDLGPNQHKGFFRYILNVCRGPHYVDFRITKEEYYKLLNGSHI